MLRRRRAIYGHIGDQSLFAAVWLIGCKSCDALEEVRTVKPHVEVYDWSIRDVGTVLSHVEDKCFFLTIAYRAVVLGQRGPFAEPLEP